MPELAQTIPQAVLDQEQEAEAALSGSAVMEVTETPAEETTVEPVAEVASETPVEETEKAKPEGSSPTETELEDPSWMNRYKTLSGKYNAEVPRLHAELRSLREKLETLMVHRPGEDRLPALRQAEEKAEGPKRPGHLRHLKDEEVKEYDSSLLDLQSRMAKGIAEEVVEDYNKEITSLKQQIQELSGQLQQTQGESFWDRVESQIPGAKEMNASDPLWHSFLTEKDPITGLSYREIGMKAIRDGAASRLVNLFGVFQRSYAGTAENPDADTTTKTGKEETETSPAPAVKPGVSRGVSRAPASRGPQVVRESEIAKFYADLNRGVYKGREKESAALEEKYDRAASEGRVVPG